MSSYELNNKDLDNAIITDLYAILLSYADARVMGNGKVVSFDERLEDIINRYGDNHIVSIANKKAWVRLKEDEKKLRKK